MSKKSYIASKSRFNRPGWSVSFSHPVRTDNRGKFGLKVRKGLGTDDPEKADQLVAELNKLLHDEAWWNGDRRTDADLKYDPIVVSAFFDGIEIVSPNSEAKREDFIALPSSDDGYSTVLFLGTTGAGKTTLLRHIIGSEQDRFPSTSTAKTTTADIEIVTAPGSFKAAITFMPKHEVRVHIDECIGAACLEAVQKKSDEKIAAALLEHHEQRFRLSYVIGTWPMTEEDDFPFEDERSPTETIPKIETVTPKEREQHNACLKKFVNRIKELTTLVEKTLDGELAAQNTADDRATWLESFGVEAFEHSHFSDISLEIMEEISERFSEIKTGNLQKAPTGWPSLWSFESEDRNQFFSAVRWFSSNHHDQFGRLLTPLVNGIRVKGPLYPTLLELDERPQLVLLDGQGLGHTATSVSSVSTRITKKFPRVDMILLVDNAQQPMQAAPLALIRSIGSSGFAEKLAIAFTHFDQVKGDNLDSFKPKREHVLGSVNNAISSLRDNVGTGVAGDIERQVDKYTFFLGGLDQKTEKLPKRSKHVLPNLIDMMQRSTEAPETSECKPIYEFKGLEIAMHDAIDAFRDPWNARLGLSYHDGISKEHWTRVKALSHRLANALADGYDNLTPVADLLTRLQEEASKWLDRPTGWTQESCDDEKRASLNRIRQAVFAKLSELSKARLTDNRVSDWREAYDYRGSGSAKNRSGKIESIYDLAVPRFNAAMSSDARAFLDELHDILRGAIKEAGGQIKSISDE